MTRCSKAGDEKAAEAKKGPGPSGHAKAKPGKRERRPTGNNQRKRNHSGKQLAGKPDLWLLLSKDTLDTLHLTTKK